MTDQDKEKLRSLLLEDKRGLEEKLQKLADVDFGSDIDSGDEESDETEELTANIPLANSFRARLKDINGALEKIEDGTYGVCESCGKELSAEMLEVNPESKLCRECKTKNG